VNVGCEGRVALGQTVSSILQLPLSTKFVPCVFCPRKRGRNHPLRQGGSCNHSREWKIEATG
jgi:hypothetical protein